MERAEKIIIETSAAPFGEGTSSQGVLYNGALYVGAQIGIDPEHGALVDGGAESQARRALANVRAILEAAGLSARHVVRARVDLKNYGDLGAVNAAWFEIFHDHPPARSVCEVSRLPHDALVQIEVVAAAPPPEPEVEVEAEIAHDAAPELELSAPAETETPDDPEREVVES